MAYVGWCKSETYRILKDATGKVVSQTLLSKDTYNALERIVRKGTKKVKKTDSTDEVVTTKPTGGVTSEIEATTEGTVIPNANKEV